MCRAPFPDGLKRPRLAASRPGINPELGAIAPSTRPNPAAESQHTQECYLRLAVAGKHSERKNGPTRQ